MCVKRPPTAGEFAQQGQLASDLSENYSRLSSTNKTSQQIWPKTVSRQCCMGTRENSVLLVWIMLACKCISSTFS